MNTVGYNAHFRGRLGMGSYIGPCSNLSAYIGRFSSIGWGCNCIDYTHPMRAPFVSTSPLFFSLDKSKTPLKETFATCQVFEERRFYDKEKMIDIKIGSDCWIGANVVFIGGIEVADGAVCLAHAVVTKDVPPYAIVGGVPARIVGYRYDAETIDRLLKIRWWEKDKSWLRDNWKLFSSMPEFLDYFKCV